RSKRDWSSDVCSSDLCGSVNVLTSVSSSVLNFLNSCSFFFVCCCLISYNFSNAVSSSLVDRIFSFFFHAFWVVVDNILDSVFLNLSNTIQVSCFVKCFFTSSFHFLNFSDSFSFFFFCFIC